MTFTEIATEIRKNLNDQGITFFTDLNIYDAMQDAYSLSVWLTKSIETTRQITQRLTLYYDFPSIFSDFLSLAGVYSLTKKLWLEPKWPKEMLEMRQDWERWRGTPQYLVQGDSRRTALSPWPAATSTGQLVVLFRSKAPTIINTDIPQLPVTKHLIIEWYATGQLFAMAKDFRQSVIWYTKFFNAISSTKKLVRDKTSADRIKVLEPYQQFGRYGFASSGDNDVHIDNEIPAGTIDGVNPTFTLQNNPYPTTSLELYKDGQLMYQGVAYTLNGAIITFNATYIPSVGSLLRAFYRLT